MTKKCSSQGENKIVKNLRLRKFVIEICAGSYKADWGTDA